jgi:hypothetical protein
MFETRFFNEVGDPSQPCPHICRQGFDLGNNRFIQSFDDSRHAIIPKMIYSVAF